MAGGLPQCTGVAERFLRALDEHLVRHPSAQLNRLHRVFGVLDPGAELNATEPRVFAQRLDDRAERAQTVGRMGFPLPLPAGTPCAPTPPAASPTPMLIRPPPFSAPHRDGS